MSVYIYVLDGVIIDTGQSNMRKHVIEQLRNTQPHKILLTHHHEDHSGNAFALGRLHQIEILGHSITAEKMAANRKILPYQRYIWGKSENVKVKPFGAVIESERFTLRPIHTPGHSKDHTVFLEEENGWLFAGDLYLGERIKYFRSDEKIYDQIDSLKKMRGYDFDALFCAHNPCPEKGKPRLTQKLQYLEDIVGQVQLLNKQGLSDNEIINLMDPNKDRWVKLMTMGNVSFANLLRSAMRGGAF
ncbi:MBL-fold metallo-hydrolase superfamily [Olavius sp. associated proteobacterium Delta 1]|nr:MBL-fold metallo-hydrolase superfamily [Olavius sp. associated proteobacterium Delta 1]